MKTTTKRAVALVAMLALIVVIPLNNSPLLGATASTDSPNARVQASVTAITDVEERIYGVPVRNMGDSQIPVEYRNQ